MNSSVIVSMVMKSWNDENARLRDLLSHISDEKLKQEIVPGKNTGIYLLGHIIAANDDLPPLFDIGKRLFPELEEIFVNQPDKSGLAMPQASALRKMWEDQLAFFNSAFKKITDSGWLDRHTRVSETDFAKEPHRNKLNVLLTRITHQSYHTGQLALLKG